jgi:hypothetical protein
MRGSGAKRFEGNKHMNKSQTKTIITMYGDIDFHSKNRWEQWLLFSADFISGNGFSPTHIGIISEKEFKSGKIIDYKKAQNRIKKTIENETIKSMELYSLPENFKQALFDYNILTIKEETINFHNLISIIVPNDIFKRNDKALLIKKMKKHIALKEGEIFEISYPENPIMYIGKMNGADYYKTLNIIERIG